MGEISATHIFLLLMIVDGIFTMINLGVLLVMVKLYTEILKIRELTRATKKEKDA